MLQRVQEPDAYAPLRDDGERHELLLVGVDPLQLVDARLLLLVHQLVRMLPPVVRDALHQEVPVEAAPVVEPHVHVLPRLAPLEVALVACRAQVLARHVAVVSALVQALLGTLERLVAHVARLGLVEPVGVRHRHLDGLVLLTDAQDHGL